MTEPRVIDVAGYPALHAEPAGERRPHAIVLLHGFWAHHEHFRHYVRAFSDAGFQTYAPSRRGRCRVPPERGAGVRFEDHVEDTLRVLDAIDGEAIVLGWSLGGLVAQKVVESRGAPALVLVAPVAPRDIREPPTWAGWPAYLHHLPAMLLGRPFGLTAREADAALLNGLPELDRRRIHDTMVDDSGTVARQIALVGVPVDETKITCPVYCCVGIDDKITPARSARRIARKYGATLREYPGRAHWLLEEPGWEGAVSDVVAWLDEKVYASAG